MNEIDDFEDFEESIDSVLLASESVAFRGVPVVLTDAAMAGAQSVGLKLFNLSEDKLVDGDNIYDGQITDAIITIFFCLCDSGEVPQDVPNREKWLKTIRPRSIGAAMMRPKMFEQTLVDFANDFEITKDIAGTFEVFNELWSHVFKTDVELPGESQGSPGKPQPASPEPSEPPLQETSLELAGTTPDTEHPPQ